jgi:hypothetical protein
MTTEEIAVATEESTTMETTFQDEAIKSIAEDLQSDLKCYVNKKTKELVSIIPLDQIDDEEICELERERYESHGDHLIELDKMPSRMAFQVMEEFVEQLADKRFQVRLMDTLERKKPFRNFRHQVDNSLYREDWFAYRDQRYFDWVKKQLVSIERSVEEEE